MCRSKLAAGLLSGHYSQPPPPEEEKKEGAADSEAAKDKKPKVYSDIISY